MIKRNLWIYKPIFILLIAFMLSSIGISIYCQQYILSIAIGFAWLVVLVGFVFWAKSMRALAYDYMSIIAKELEPSKNGAVENFPLPVIVSNENNEIIWYNGLFKDNVLDGVKSFGVNIGDVITDFSPQKAAQEGSYNVCVGEKKFTVHSSKYENKKNKQYYASYFIEDTDLKFKANEYDMSRPSLLIIALDSYQDLFENAKQSEKSQTLARLEKIVEDFVSGANGFLQRVKADTYVAIIEERYMEEIVGRRFEVLDEVRQVMITPTTQATLSIGVSRGNTSLIEAEKMAKAAFEMALGRGGDQVALKTKNGYEFYGGVSKGVEKRNKVKSRIVASAMSELIKSSDNVLVMGHKFGDLDSIGSAVGMARAVKSLDKDVRIVVNRQRCLANNLIDRMIENGYENVFIEPKVAVDMVSKKTLLIIVDTHMSTMLESLELYNNCKNVIVIDHHRKMVNYIENAVIFYHEPFSSSACEMVTEIIQHIMGEETLDRFEAEALLAGMMLDTKNFVMKSGIRTFEAAAHLKKHGADTVSVKKLFASTAECYQNKAEIIGSSVVYERCAIAYTEKVNEHLRLAAPQAADELLGIVDVDASFVMYKSGNGINFSARSMGDINVQLIMEKLGGGGHLTMAGCYIVGADISSAIRSLKTAIDEYNNEKTSSDTTTIDEKKAKLRPKHTK